DRPINSCSIEVIIAQYILFYRERTSVVPEQSATYDFVCAACDVVLLGPDRVLAAQHRARNHLRCAARQWLDLEKQRLKYGRARRAAGLAPRRYNRHWVTGKRGWARATTAGWRCGSRPARVSPRGP